MDINKYFSKIRLDYINNSDIIFTPNLDNLYNIHTHQSFNIPFDMLDYHLGIEPNLDPDYIFNKLVNNNRGGGCSQVNELLALILDKIGFKVHRLLSRILFNKDEEQRAYSPLGHKILLVEFDDNNLYLCDLGFSTYGLLEPIPLRANKIFKQYNNYYQLINDISSNYILQRKFNGQWIDLFSFDLKKFLPHDYIAINYYNSKNPNSLFTQNLIVNIPTSQGRRLLINNYYKETIGSQKITKIIKSNKEYTEILNNKFNIRIKNLDVDLYQIANKLHLKSTLNNIAHPIAEGWLKYN